MFRPFLIKNAITDLDAQWLKEQGIAALLLDVDNTLTSHDSQEVSPAIIGWLSEMQKAGVKLTVVSNGKYERVKPFAEKLGLSFISLAAKPLPFGFFRAVKALGFSKKQCAVVGDQLFTDLLGGKLAGIRVILLHPIEPEIGKPFIQFKRRLEKPIVRRWTGTEDW